MTSRRSRVAALMGAGALACTGFALASGPAFADTASTTPTPHQQQCDKAPWQSRVQGAPKGFDAGSLGGDYLWHSSDGFHLRVTHETSKTDPAKTDQRVYSGEITSPKAMRLEPVKLEGRDSVALSANHKVITFRFYNYGGIDGINFHTDCARSLTLSKLDVANRPLSTDRVFLGYYKEHPAKVPFTVKRYGGPS